MLQIILGSLFFFSNWLKKTVQFALRFDSINPPYQKEVSMNKLLALLLLFLLSFQSFSRADREVPNQAYRQYSLSERFYIDIFPPGGFKKQGHGVAYRNDSTESLWKVNWYARRIVLSDDGNHLVRLDQWARDQKGLSDQAIAFYDRGKELKRYLVRDLVKDVSYLEMSVSHYVWEAAPPSFKTGLSKDNKYYTLAVIDGTIDLR